MIFAGVLMPLSAIINLLIWALQLVNDSDWYRDVAPPLVLLDVVSSVVVQLFVLVIGILGAIGVMRGKHRVLQIGLVVLLAWSFVESILLLLFMLAEQGYSFGGYTPPDVLAMMLDSLRLLGALACFWWLTVQLARRGAAR